MKNVSHIANSIHHTKLSALQKAQIFLHEHPEVETLEVCLYDVNGIQRGKWIPVNDVAKLFNGEFKMPITVTTPDIWGRDVANICESTGDKDGICLPVVNSLKVIPWLKVPTAQMLLKMTQGDTLTPCPLDPRVQLASQVERFQKRGWRAVIAPELEFYLFEKNTENKEPKIPPSALNGKQMVGGQIYNTETLEQYQHLLNDIRHTCNKMEIPIGAITKELSPGQWEINLQHCDCPLTAADNALALKRIIKHLADKHGYRASFMAKPLAHCDGNGYHSHISIIDKKGYNLFNNGSAKGSKLLRFAIAGLCEIMAESFLLFAPHLNSYRRLTLGGHASKAPNWGYENRYVHLRIPSGANHSRRIEHRTAGADANPYLVQAAIMAGIIHGIDNQIKPFPPCNNKRSARVIASQLPLTWEHSLARFSQSTFINEHFGEDFQRAYAAIKQQEIEEFQGQLNPFEYDTYLNVS